MRTRLVAASAAALLGFVLLGGGSTGAALRDTSGSGAVVLSAGALLATLSAAGPVAVAGSNPSVVAAGTTGLVPGVRGQAWTYTVTNTTGSAVPASTVLALTTTAAGSALPAVQPYLVATATPAGGTAQGLTVTPSAVSGTVTLPGRLLPGGSTTVVVALSLPASSGSVDVARLLLPQRSAPVVTLSGTATLVQLPRTA